MEKRASGSQKASKSSNLTIKFSSAEQMLNKPVTEPCCTHTIFGKHLSHWHFTIIIFSLPSHTS